MRLKLLLAFALVVLITLSVVALYTRQSAAQEVYTFVYRGGIYGAEDLVTTLEAYYLSNGAWEGVIDLLLPPGKSAGSGQGKGQGRGLGASGSIDSQGLGNLQLYDADGIIVYDPHNAIPQERLSPEDLGSTIPLIVKEETVGYLLAPTDQRFIQGVESSLLENFNRALFNAAIIAGALSLVLAFLIAYYLIRPVRNLTHAAQEMSQGDLSQRVKVRGNDELATLGSAFNQMAHSLEEEQGRRRAMTADIAHELRTPLAIQRANLEALTDGVYPLTTDNLEPILEQNKLLTRLVGDLRTLALADAGELELIIRKFILNPLVSSVVERFNPKASQRKVGLITNLDPNCASIEVDPERIEQILSNLVDNALRYTPGGSNIWVKTVCSKNSARISVRDSGPGIPTDKIQLVFDRFYREDRSRSEDGEGTGLGLAIARKLAEAHGGTLSAANHPEGGAVFTLKLPMFLKGSESVDRSDDKA